MIKREAFLLLSLILILPNIFAAIPNITYFAIDSNNAYTNQQKPALNTTATDANGMKFSCNNSNYTQFFSYAATYADFNILDTTYGCSSGDGTKTVYVRVESSDGNLSVDTNSDSIIYDATKPGTTATNYDNDWNASDQNVLFQCSDALSGCNSITVTVDGSAGSCSALNASNQVNCLITTDGNHQVVFYSTDKASNQETANTIYVPIDKSAPTISNNFTGYTSDNTPRIEFDVNDSGSGVNINTLRMSVDGNGVLPTKTVTHVSFDLNYTTNDKTITVNVDVNDNLDRRLQTSWSFTVDTQAPSSISITADIGDNWTNDETPTFTLSASDSSGITGMKFSCNNSSWSSEIAYATSYSAFDITSGNGCDSANGTKTIYVQFKDAASNWTSTATSDTVKYDNSAPDKVSSLGASAGNGEVVLNWSAPSDSGGSGVKEYRIYRDDSYIESVTGTSRTVTGLTNGTIYRFRVSAVDNAGSEGEKSDEKSATPTSTGTISGDTTDPTVSWVSPADDSTVSGIVTLKANANDADSGVYQVKFYVDGSIIDTVSSKTAGYYVLDWNSMKVSNGTHTLRVLAIDRAATPNSAGAEITVTVQNGPIATEEEEAEEAIREANDAKEEVEELVQELEGRGITVSGATNDVIDEANEKLENADTQFDAGNYTGAKNLAESAKRGFEAAKGMLSMETYGEQDYAYNPNTLAIILQGMGMSETLADEINELLDSHSISRALEIVKVVDGNETIYMVNVKIVIENTGDEESEIKIVERIPKEFIENAGSIVSNLPFEILEEDPIIVFNLTLDKDEKIEIFYGKGEPLSKSEADALLESSPMESFVVPPLLLKASTAVDTIALGITAPTPTGLFGLGAGLTFWVAIAIAIIVVAIIGAFLVMSYLQGRTEEERPFGLHSVIEEEPFYQGFLDSIKGMVSREEKEEKRKPKWGYKE